MEQRRENGRFGMVAGVGFHDRALQPDDYRAMPDGTLQRLMAAGDRGAGEEFRRRLEQFRKEIEDGVDQELQGG